jgi:hypothetical protein
MLLQEICYDQMGVRIVESITLSLGWFSTHHKIALKTKELFFCQNWKLNYEC